MMAAHNRKANAKAALTAMAVLVMAGCGTTANEARGGIDQGLKRDRYLLLDSRVIETAENAKLTVGSVRKDKNNPLFREDKPWEKRFDNLYPNVLYDPQDKLYKCWYNPFIKDPGVEKVPREKYATIRYPQRDRELALCYAFSKDGIHWTKPLVGKNGKDNIVHQSQSFGCSIDPTVHAPTQITFLSRLSLHS